jgi:alginate O-acetyltransferase complex protein AlgI
MFRVEHKHAKKSLLALSIGINLALLFYFKYANFFADNLNIILKTFSENQLRLGKVLLPIGISFYTFESITYSVDIYRGIHKPLKRFTDYLLYILLFPKLIAGPIVRYQEIAGQLRSRVGKETIDNVLTGLYRFSIGLAKKTLIANEMGLIADRLMSGDVLNLSSPDAWIGALAYTFQIYFDFSGYSDMAIGLCKMMGFNIPENFESPYTSKSITEFWRRWHISLGKWMKNYLYIPLGGNKSSSQWLNYRNLWVVFFLSGLWHGASWTFIIWGLYHGFFIILERSFKNSIFSKINPVIKTVVTFIIVTVGWVFFRIENIGKAKEYFSFMFNFTDLTIGDYTASFWFYFSIAVVFSIMVKIPGGQLLKEYIYRTEHSLRSHGLMTVMCSLLLILSIFSISANGFNPFIYFRF